MNLDIEGRVQGYQEKSGSSQLIDETICIHLGNGIQRRKGSQGLRHDNKTWVQVENSAKKTEKEFPFM